MNVRLLRLPYPSAENAGACATRPKISEVMQDRKFLPCPQPIRVHNHGLSPSPSLIITFRK